MATVTTSGQERIMVSREFTLSQVHEHDTKHDLWLIVHGKVYDVTSFIRSHPGGEEVLFDAAGGDASNSFEDVGHSEEAREILRSLEVGTLRSKGEVKFELPDAATHGRTSKWVLFSIVWFIVALILAGYQFMPFVSTLDGIHA